MATKHEDTEELHPITDGSTFAGRIALAKAASARAAGRAADKRVARDGTKAK